MVWMLLLAFHLGLYYTNFTETPYQVPLLLGLEIPLPLIHGVFLFMYVAAVTNQLPEHNWQILLHFLPLSIGYLYLLPLLTSDNQNKISFYQNGFQGYREFMQYGLFLIFISGIVYVAWSALLLQKHKKNIRNQFSNLEEVNLDWLRFLTIGLGVVWSIVIITNNDRFIFLGVSVFVILIGFFGVQQRTIFTTHVSKVNHGNDEQPLKKEPKYIKSGLKAEVAEKTYQDLINLFVQEKYFKKNDLSLDVLASKLNINSNYLSQVINEKEGQSFYDFVNSYRLKEFKQLVKTGQNKRFTLLALAYECGFNSKSSFNRYFRQKVGCTPSSFVRSVEKEH
jgi:AraC-like DNA-binding protein